MCNLYNLKVDRWELETLFQTNEEWRREISMEKDYVAPGKPGLVIREEGEGADRRRVIDTMKWGFPHQGKPVTNVRNYRSPFWRSALANPTRRCLVPVTEFEEWSVSPDPTTGKKKRYRFDLPSQRIFAFAGIWRPTEAHPVFSFLTCGYSDDPELEAAAAAAHVVGAIHPKAIPVILQPDDYDRWLHAELDDALQLATACPSQLMTIKT